MKQNLYSSIWIWYV